MPLVPLSRQRNTLARRDWFVAGAVAAARVLETWGCGTLDVAHMVGRGSGFRPMRREQNTARLPAFCLVIAGAALVPAAERARAGLA
jgi:hypothetical protein